MALGDSYATLTELKSRLGITDTNDDARLTNALAVASRGIEKNAHRQFNDAGSATARRFRTKFADCVEVDDFSTTTGLVVESDDDEDGTFDRTWTLTTDYELEPLDGIVDGETGWPYSSVVAVGDKLFGVYLFRPAARVTARWGWAAVPSPIKEACLIVAEETFKLKDAPFGVAGFAEYGAVRVRENPIAMQMVGPYIRDKVLVG